MDNNFPLFFAYHYWWYFTKFHIKWLQSIESDKNVFIEGFRASRKTTMIKGYIVRCIVYKKWNYIVRQSYEDKHSKDNVRDVAKMLCNDSIVNDYWLLFPLATKKEELMKKSLSNFDTTNWIKVTSTSLWQTLRGANTFDFSKNKTERPQLLVLDDIDTTKSVQNQSIIEKNEQKILWETINALDPLINKIIFLGNTIYDDWVVPRFYHRYKKSEQRDCYRQALYVEWENVRPDVFTDEVVAKLQSHWEIAWNQNYMCIPYSWQWIVNRTRIRYTQRKENYDKIIIGIDPAVSTKTLSDWFAIVVTGRIGESKDILEAYNIKGKDKSKDKIIMFIKNLYERRKPKIVNYESISAFAYLAQDLKEAGIALKELKPNKDKVTRLLEKESELKNWVIQFVEWTDVAELVQQLIMFPNGKHDDLVDAMVFACTDKKKWMFYASLD